MVTPEEAIIAAQREAFVAGANFASRDDRSFRPDEADLEDEMDRVYPLPPERREVTLIDGRVVWRGADGEWFTDNAGIPTRGFYAPRTDTDADLIALASLLHDEGAK